MEEIVTDWARPKFRSSDVKLFKEGTLRFLVPVSSLLILLIPATGWAGFLGSSIEAKVAYVFKSTTSQNSFQFTSLSAYVISPELFVFLNSSGSAQVVLRSDLKATSYRVTSGQQPRDDFLADVRLGARFQIPFARFFPYAGITGTSYIQATGASSATLTNGYRPLAGLRVDLTPLHGPNHDINLSGFGEFWFPYRAGALDFTAAYSIGGEVSLSLVPARIPLAFLGFINYKSLTVNSEAQIEYQYGFGIKLFLAEPAHEENPNPRNYYRGKLME